MAGCGQPDACGQLLRSALELDQEVPAVAELEDDDAEPALDFESEVDGVESDVDLPFEPGSALPFEPDSADPDWVDPDWADADWAELPARLSLL
ncbi:MAG: hypothetical protein ACRDRI_26115 [Pseudonocardiaceae bacterium]